MTKNSGKFLTALIFLLNCSLTKFVAVLLVLSVFYAIFRLIDISSDPFDVSSTKTGSTGSAQGALRFLRAFELTSFKVCDSQKMFRRLIFMV